MKDRHNPDLDAAFGVDPRVTIPIDMRLTPEQEALMQEDLFDTGLGWKLSLPKPNLYEKAFEPRTVKSPPPAKGRVVSTCDGRYKWKGSKGSDRAKKAWKTRKANAAKAKPKTKASKSKPSVKIERVRLTPEQVEVELAKWTNRLLVARKWCRRLKLSLNRYKKQGLM